MALINLWPPSPAHRLYFTFDRAPRGMILEGSCFDRQSRMPVRFSCNMSAVTGTRPASLGWKPPGRGGPYTSGLHSKCWRWQAREGFPEIAGTLSAARRFKAELNPTEHCRSGTKGTWVVDPQLRRDQKTIEYVIVGPSGLPFLDIHLPFVPSPLGYWSWI